MLNGVLYRLQTIGYFDPKLRSKATKEDLIKILQLKIRNPNKIKGINKDYDIYVANFNDGKGKNNKQIIENSSWAGKFSTNGRIQIVFNGEEYLYIEPTNSNPVYIEDIRGKNIFSNGPFEYHHISTKRIIQTDVGLTEIKKILTTCLYK